MRAVKIQARSARRKVRVTCFLETNYGVTVLSARGGEGAMEGIPLPKVFVHRHAENAGHGRRPESPLLGARVATRWEARTPNAPSSE